MEAAGRRYIYPRLLLCALSAQQLARAPQSTPQLLSALEALARLESASPMDDGTKPLVYVLSTIKRLRVLVLIGRQSRQHVAQHTSYGVDIGARIGLRKAVLLGACEAPGSQRGRIFPHALAMQTRDTEIDQMGPVLGDDDVPGCDISVDHTELMERRRCRAQVERKAHGLPFGDPHFGINKHLERFAMHIFIDNRKLVGQLIGCRHLREPVARLRGCGKRSPDASFYQRKRNLLPDKRPRVLNRHQLGDAIGPPRQHPLDVIHIVDKHRVHHLLVVQSSAVH